MAIDKFNREKYTKLLEKTIIKGCCRCNETSFSLLNGYGNINLLESFSPGSVVIGGGINVPYITTVCNHCGFISNHAIGALDKEYKWNDDATKKDKIIAKLEKKIRNLKAKNRKKGK